MKNPFNIFPKIGYKNSQFQVISSVNNLKIDILYGNKIIKSFNVSSDHPVLLTKLGYTGKFVAQCNFEGEIFHQEIEVKEALRLGSSEFKKAFVFDDSDLSFFLMNDRLLLYDEKKKVLLTENHYSPTEIHQLDKFNFLFVTRIGDANSGIVNLGIYNSEKYSFEGELLNRYQEIKILPDTNKAWLFNKKEERIQCLELIGKSDGFFSELRTFEESSDFFIDNISQRIFVNYADTLIISDLNDLHQTLEISKLSNTTIDKWGNIFKLENRRLSYRKCFNGFTTTSELPFDINLKQDDFIHIGNDFKLETQRTDFKNEVERIKDDIFSLINTEKSYCDYLFPDSDRIEESHVTHQFYLTVGGVYIFQKRNERKFYGIRFKKYQSEWNARPLESEKNDYSLLYCSEAKCRVFIEKSPYFSIDDYRYPTILINSQDKSQLFTGEQNFSMGSDNSIKFLSENNIAYFLIKHQENFSLYQSGASIRLVLKDITILNYEFINDHNLIWYVKPDITGNRSSQLFVFDLRTCSAIQLDRYPSIQSIIRNSIYFQFQEGYALTSNQEIFNPRNLESFGSCPGNIQAYSKQLRKTVSIRGDIIYLSHYNNLQKAYTVSEIPIKSEKYNESFLSPDGKFLVLKESGDKYIWYDIERNEAVNFFSGKFLTFRSDGSLIIENDGRRAARVIDPQTFQDITPPNYHYYRFLSPDGKLYAQVASKERYYNKLTNKEISRNEYLKIQQELNQPSIFDQESERKKIEVERKRIELFYKFETEMIDLGIEDPSKLNSFKIIRIDKYTEIGIVGTEVSVEVPFPEDLLFYNYAAFSYDNKYFGYVGKPSTNGLVNLFKIDFDEENRRIKIVDSYLSRLPKMASWVCGFSKTGYFATYDSVPNTYIILTDDEIFENRISDMDLRTNILHSKSNIYYSYNKWNIIKGKNFLCFSPSGEYLALSEQGYEPSTLGGYGHQESSAIHIAKTKTGEIIRSFKDHGTYLVDPKVKDVIFVSFSEDEKRLMTMSKDGVVIIRDIQLNLDEDKNRIEQIENIDQL